MDQRAEQQKEFLEQLQVHTPNVRSRQPSIIESHQNSAVAVPEQKLQPSSSANVILTKDKLIKVPKELTTLKTLNETPPLSKQPSGELNDMRLIESKNKNAVGKSLDSIPNKLGVS